MKKTLILFLLLMFNDLSAHAFSSANGFLNGFTHPFLGLDHLFAMLAVGVWASMLGKKQVYVLPISFPIIMSIGAILGMLNYEINNTEVFISLSCLILGTLVLFSIKVSLIVSIFITGLFAIFHGYAHGIEMPSNNNPLVFTISFMLSTGILHALGIFMAELNLKKINVKKISGIIITIAGLYYLFLTLI